MKLNEKTSEKAVKKKSSQSTKPTSIVVGAGETGSSLYRILLWGKGIQNFIIDKDEVIEGEEHLDVKYMHICIPYTKDFVKIVKAYQKRFDPEYTIIHATVPIGTSEKCDAYHSPLRGVHPVLDKSLWTFVKYLAPANKELKEYFELVGMEVVEGKSSRDTEALKLLSTTYYGWNIMFEKLVYEFCEKNGLDYNLVYRDSNETYNEGYRKMGMPHVRRPVLHHSDGEIGGHCVMPNLDLFDLPVNEFIKTQNRRLKNRSKVSGVQKASTKGRRRNDWRNRS